MSSRSWEEEFYPLSASRVSEKDALDHSIRRCTGLLVENMDRHRLKIGSDHNLVSKSRFRFSWFPVQACSCALCLHHLDRIGCGRCPLVRSGELCCNDKHSPWKAWRRTGDVRPLLAALNRAKEWG